MTPIRGEGIRLSEKRWEREGKWFRMRGMKFK